MNKNDLLTLSKAEIIKEINIYCSDCYNCNGCNDCNNISDEKYIILDIQLTKEEYKTFIKKMENE